jgi:hypothetical protein
MSSLDKQIGGGHYKDMVIQPIEFTHKNKLNFCQGNVIKYITRYKAKNGLEDLEKVIHYVELLMELEYGKTKKKSETQSGIRVGIDHFIMKKTDEIPVQCESCGSDGVMYGEEIQEVLNHNCENSKDPIKH